MEKLKPESDLEFLNALIAKADAEFDGHLTICKFTTNWRIGFITPNERADIGVLCEGKKFTDAALLALSKDKSELDREYAARLEKYAAELDDLTDSFESEMGEDS